MIRKTVLVILVSGCLVSACFQRKPAGKMDAVITVKEPKSPYVAFNIWIRCGSQDDPIGKEGLASITAALLSEGATQKNSYEEILNKLYPMAAGYDGSVDKEMTSFRGVVYRDHLEAYYGLIKDAILEPAFRQEDFHRIKNQTMNYLKQTRRFSNDEELTKELLFREIYRSTRYEHPEEGYVHSVDSITLDDVKDFYSKHYTRNTLSIAVGGGYPEGFPERMRSDFDVLPARPVPALPKPSPVALEGIHVLLVEKNTNSSPVSFGFPISLLRSDKDFPAMMLFNSSMGEHRNSFGRLYQVIRETRGINYGDYTYIEAYPRGYSTQLPPTNVSRRSQIFEGWLRPIAATKPGTLHDRTLFTIRAAVRELTQIAEKGMDAGSFEAARLFLKNYTVNYGSTLSRRLAYRVDDAFYGIPEPGFLTSLKPELEALTLDRVNASIRKYIQTKNLCIVVITRDAESFKRKLLSATPTGITYEGPQPKEVLEEDRAIAAFPIPVQEQDIRIVSIDDVFE